MSDAVEAKRYLETLDAKLKARNPEIALWERYFEGIHRLQFATSRFRSIFGNLFREFADNWCPLVVEASVERLLINGFRAGSEANEADLVATKIWRDNCLDADYRIAHTEAVKLGHAYVLVDAENKAPETDSPLITIEHPAQAIVLHHPASQRLRLAGLKEWIDENERLCATLYMADKAYRFEGVEKSVSGEGQSIGWSGLQAGTDYTQSPSDQTGHETEWVPRSGVPFETENTLGVVPLVPLRNNPTLKGGRSDIAVVIPLQDAVNKTVADMMIASEFASFAQRWATGLEVPKDPQTGKALNNQEFISGPGRVWIAEHPDAKFGQFEASNLQNYVHAVEMLIQHVAALTRTPPHYLLGQSGSFPSGDSLTATETGLVAKVRSKQTDFQVTWNEVMKLAFRVIKSDQATQQISTIWADPEQRIYSQRVDGAIKLSTLGVPQDALFEEIGKTPEEVARWHAMKKAMAEAEPGSPEAAEHSTEFAIPPAPAPGEKPLPSGPEGNLVQEQAISTAERVARIND
jgi:hypothetical protein